MIDLVWGVIVGVAGSRWYEAIKFMRGRDPYKAIVADNQAKLVYPNDISRT